MHDSKQQNETPVAGRRQFIKGLAVASAAGLAASAGTAVAAPQPQVATDSTVASEGYHETDHIRAYYASCR